MSSASNLRSFGLAGLLAMTWLAPAAAQAPGGEPSTACRLFPLACPGPVPPQPQPLLGLPDEQTEAPPPPVEHVAKHRRHAAHKHATRPAVQ